MDNDSGMTIRDGCAGMLKYGVAPEFTWPYYPYKYNDEPSWSAYFLANLFRPSRYERLNTINEINISLTQNIPVICGIRVDNSFYNLNKDNYTWVPGVGYNGGHAVCIIGYDEKRRVLIIDNSWGTTFGNNGTFEVSYENFLNVSFDYFRLLP
jgi:C1A family cysteine protease